MSSTADTAGRGTFISPSLGLLAKLGSAIVHADEHLSGDGRPIDLHEFQRLLADPEVVGWLKYMDKIALVPKRRVERKSRPH